MRTPRPIRVTLLMTDGERTALDVLAMAHGLTAGGMLRHLVREAGNAYIDKGCAKVAR